MIKIGPLSLAALVSLAALDAARADCRSDIRLQNSIAEQYNALAASPACDSGSQQAVILGLLQQAVEVTTRLESCETATITTTVAKLNSMIANIDSSTAEYCGVIRASEQLDRDLEDLMSGISKEAEKLKAESKAFSDEAAKLRKQLRELDAAENRKQEAAAKPPLRRRGSSPKCDVAVAHMRKLAEGGNDVTGLKAELARQGCNID